MASHTRSVSRAGVQDKTYFEQQREELIGEIATSFEQVLANINKLNRSLEAVIAVGNEFSSVEALWSQFENVMAKEPEDEQAREGDDAAAGGGHGHGHDSNDQAEHDDRNNNRGHETRS